MESTYRKAEETQYEYREMSVKQYMEFCGIAESTVHARLTKVDQGIIQRDILDYEQLAPGYPITLFVRVRVPRGTIQ
jgi:DNA-binding Lrp family transcriptional regulator